MQNVTTLRTEHTPYTHTHTHTHSHHVSTVGLYLPQTGWTTHHIDQHPNGFEHTWILIHILYVG